MSRVMVIVLLASLPAAATELRYVWRKDAIQHYRYEETVHWKGGAILTVHAQLAERVRALRADGSALVEVTLEALAVSFETQSFDLLDEAHQRVVIRTDAKGHLVAPATWRVGVRDRRPFVEPPDATRKSVDMVDVIPRRLLAVLSLPEGRLQPGRAVHMKSGLQWRLAKVQGAEATLFVTDSAAATGHSATQAPKPEAADLMLRFDAAQGRLLEARGILISTRSTRAISRVLIQSLP